MREKIKVLFIVSTLEKSGPIYMLHDIVKSIDNSRFSPVIMTLSPEGGNSMEPEFMVLGIEIYKLNLSRLAMVVSGKNRFKNLVKSIQPDLIHSHCLRADFYTSRYVRSIPTFSTIHNYPHLDYPFLHGKILGGIMAKVQLGCIKNTNFPIACSKAISDELKTVFNIDSGYIRNGIDAVRFRPQTLSKKLELREKYSLQKQARYIISAGLLSERKNPLLVIEAFNRAELPSDFFLILIGKGELLDECKRRMTKQIILLDYTDFFDEYLSLSDYYVSASNAEGMPLAVLQAMASGLPVILSNIPPHLEIFGVNPDIGLLFESNSPSGLIEAFKAVPHLDYESSRLAARNTVEGCFSNLKMTRSYEKAYIESQSVEPRQAKT